MKNTKKLFSLLLALIMIFSLCVPAFAAEAKTNLVVLGDSIAQGYGLGDSRDDWYTSAYGQLIADANGYNYKNHAIGGHTTYNLNKRLKEDVVITDVADADIIIVSIGGNNFLLGGIALMAINGLLFKNYDLIDQTADEFYVDFCLAIDTIKTINPDATLMVQTLYNPRTDFLKDVYQYGVDRLNAYIRQAAAEKSYTVVDVAAAFVGHAGEYIQDDVIHPNDLGHYVIATEYLKVMKTMGLGQAEKPLGDAPIKEVPVTLWQQIIEYFKKLLPFLF